METKKDSNVQAAYIEILEEPAGKALRFRYECEGRSAGSLPGAGSKVDKKTWPKIRISGCPGNTRGICVVSCVTVDPPYRPHPHNLVGREGCRKGVCTLEINGEDNSLEFPNLGIQCIKKKDIEESLRVRTEIRVDPFKTGFGHATQPNSIDLNAVRLCFQVFLEGPEAGQFGVPLKPVVSQPVFDKKSLSDLTILKLSDCSSPVVGNKEVILLCDKVAKDDIEVRFYEEDSDGNCVWEALADFNAADVHKQYAISFRTPQYRDLEITHSRLVQVQLRCPSKSSTSAPRPFQYLPLISGRKRLWNLTAYSRTGHGGQMLASTDSAIEDPGVKNRKLQDVLLNSEGLYKELSEIRTGFNEPLDFDMDFENVPEVQRGAEWGAIGANPAAADTNSHLNPPNGEIVEHDPDLNALGLLVDENVQTEPSACAVVAADACSHDPDSVYTSFMLAMRNPLAIPPPRPPKLELPCAEVTNPPPALPPRRKKQTGSPLTPEKEQKSSSPGQPNFLAKLFGTGVNKKSQKPEPNANCNLIGLNLNQVRDTAPESLMTAQSQPSTTSKRASATELPSPTTALLQSLIAQEQSESGNGSCAMDLTEAENYALYVDSCAPLAKLGSEFDESSVYYGEIGQGCLVGSAGNELDSANNN